MNKKSGILDTISKYLVGQDHFPVLNPDAANLQKEILKFDPDLAVVKRLIQTDATLTGEILKVANSPYYKGLGEVSTIKEASLRLGQNELFNIIIRVIQRHNFSSDNPMIKKRQKQLWDYSIATAFSSNWLTRHLKMADLTPQAFIAGLLHDMGKLCLLSAFEKMLTHEKDAASLTPDLIEKILNTFHPKQGYALLKRWHLPDQYCRIAKNHEVSDFDTTDTLLVVVRLACMTCDRIRLSNSNEDLSQISGSQEADILGVNEMDIALLEIALEDAGLMPCQDSAK